MRAEKRAVDRRILVRSHNCAEASVLLDGLPETRERKQLELDIHVTLTQALMAGKGYSDPEAVAALERANRLVTETASVGTPLHFSVKDAEVKTAMLRLVC